MCGHVRVIDAFEECIDYFSDIFEETGEVTDAPELIIYPCM